MPEVNSGVWRERIIHRHVEVRDTGTHTWLNHTGFFGRRCCWIWATWLHARAALLQIASEGRCWAEMRLCEGNGFAFCSQWGARRGASRG